MANQAADSISGPVLAQREHQADSKTQPPIARMGFAKWKAWNSAVLIGLAAALVLIISLSVFRRRASEQAPAMRYLQPNALTAFDSLQSAGVAAPEQAAMKARSDAQNGPVAATRQQAPAGMQAPMIARTAALTILVKNLAAARASLDTMVAKHNGYGASLVMDTPESGQRQFRASLRIPADQFAQALADLKALGRTLNETQSGEEVTQQHSDLVARLQNSRETEQRLRAILEQRTGKIEDVLQVEEEIARVRGEIESMEAEQKMLEHRVTFATVDLQLTEEYKEHFNSSPVSTSGRLHNAFIEGMSNAAETALGLALFVEEFGPAILIWFALLGVPAYFVWRRYRRTRAKV
jgi:hypothetical protein